MKREDIDKILDDYLSEYHSSLVKDYIDKYEDIVIEMETSLRWINQEVVNMKKILQKKPELLEVKSLIEFLDRWDGLCDLEYYEEFLGSDKE